MNIAELNKEERFLVVGGVDGQCTCEAYKSLFDDLRGDTSFSPTISSANAENCIYVCCFRFENKGFTFRDSSGATTSGKCSEIKQKVPPDQYRYTMELINAIKAYVYPRI